MGNTAGNTAITKAEKNAFTVSYEVLGVTVELDIKFVKEYLVRGKANLVSDQEILFFMHTCKAQKLNPLVQGEVFLIKYSDGDPAQIQVGKWAYLRKATEHPDYLCKEDGITVKRGEQIVQKEGCCLYPGEELIGGWCKVHYTCNGKDLSAFKEVSLSEYNKGMANWKSKPATMINKVAVSQCVREAFPKEYEGVYSEEELTASGVIPSELDNPQPVAGENNDPPIEQKQRKQLFGKAKVLFGDEGNDVIARILAEFGLSSTTGMPITLFEKAMIRLDELKQQSENIIDVTPIPVEQDDNEGTPFA